MTAKTEQIAQALRGAFGELIVSITEALGEVTLVVKSADLSAVMTVLRDGDGLRFEQLIDACGVDYSSYGKEAWDGAPPKGGAGGRFAVVYHLLSLTNIWPSANWFEREAFDLYGIIFNGHPDLRRILTDYGFIGHPFRKDFPISGNVEMRYDPDQQRVIYQPVSIEPREIVPRIVREEHYADSEGFRKG